MDQGSTRKRSAVHNFAPTVTKFCVMWEGQALPHDTKFGNSRCEIVGMRVIFIWSLIHGSSWSALIKVGPELYWYQAQATVYSAPTHHLPPHPHPHPHPINMPTVHTLLFLFWFYSYASRLLHRHLGNHMIAYCQWRKPGPRLNIKTVLSTYGDFHVKDKTAVRTSYF